MTDHELAGLSREKKKWLKENIAHLQVQLDDEEDEELNNLLRQQQELRHKLDVSEEQKLTKGSTSLKKHKTKMLNQ